MSATWTSTGARATLTGRARVVVIAVALVAAGAAACVLAATRWGIGTSPDSVHYIKAARALAAEGPATASEALTHYAPLYPLVLAGGVTLGQDVMVWARLLNAVLLALTVLLCGLVVVRSTPEATWLGLPAAVLVAASVPSLGVHTVALSEPLSLLFALAGFVLLARHLETPSMAALVGAGAALGLALFARYAGAASVLAAGLAVLLFSRTSLVARIRDGAILGLVSAAPLVVWKATHAAAVAGPARELVFHPVGRAQAWQAIYTVSAWVLVPPSAPNVVRLSVLALAALAVAGAWFLRRRRGASTPRVIAVLALFVPVYGAFLALSLSLFDANTPLDDRILLPAFVAAVVVCAHLCGEAAAARRPGALAVASAFLLVVMTGQAVRAAREATTGYARGLGFTSVAWRQSPALAALGSVPANVPVYSNVPEAVYLNTGRDPRPLPRRTVLVTRRPNERFEDELAEAGRALRERCGVVVYFRGVTDNSPIVPAGELESRLSLRVRWSGPDGSILEVPGCAR